MAKDTQISAYISNTTKERLDLYCRETGITKGRAVEDAINAHLDAVEELPADAIIPTRIVLTRESGEEFLRDLENPSEPTPALVELMKKHEDLA